MKQVLYKKMFTYRYNKANKVSPKIQSALQKPHGNHVVGQRHDIVIEFKRIAVSQSNSKHGHILVGNKIHEN